MFLLERSLRIELSSGISNISLVLYQLINRSLENFVLVLDTTWNKKSQIHQSVNNFCYIYEVFDCTFCEKILKVSGDLCWGCQYTRPSFPHLAIQRILRVLTEKNSVSSHTKFHLRTNMFSICFSVKE